MRAQPRFPKSQTPNNKTEKLLKLQKLQKTRAANLEAIWGQAATAACISSAGGVHAEGPLIRALRDLIQVLGTCRAYLQRFFCHACGVQWCSGLFAACLVRQDDCAGWCLHSTQLPIRQFNMAYKRAAGQSIAACLATKTYTSKLFQILKCE